MSFVRNLIMCLLLACCAPAAKAVGRVWTTEALAQLRAVAESAPNEGLPPETEALDELNRFEGGAQPPQAGDQVDVAADALFDSLARAFATGATDPVRADPAWAIARPAEPDLVALHASLATGAAPDMLLRALLPQSSEYVALRAELQRVTSEQPGQRDSAGLDRETRLARLRANLERWRWLPRALETTRVEVRVPAHQALLFRDGAVVSTHGVIVGTPRTPTPTFSAAIRTVTLNPNWDPPTEILLRELLPRFARNPAAAAQEGFEALDANGAAVDPSVVNWAARPFPYRVRQRPGPANALGRIRFDLPNPYSIFLHDTPNRALFTGANLALSHGCIRVDNPLGLATGVLGSAEWTPESLQAAIDTGEQRIITLPTPTKVYLLYLTAAVGDEGAIAYYDDVYRRDPRLIAALDAPDVALVAENSVAPERCPAS